MSTVVLTTTTLFKIALKKDEIELMGLIGASNFYIRKPFLQEGVFLGLVASSFSFIIILLIFLYLNPFLSSYLKGIPALETKIFNFSLNVWPINLLFLVVVFILSSLFGILISILSSLLATRKYLKV
jgi:cell division transport system permease protein